MSKFDQAYKGIVEAMNFRDLNTGQVLKPKVTGLKGEVGTPPSRALGQTINTSGILKAAQQGRTSADLAAAGYENIPPQQKAELSKALVSILDRAVNTGKNAATAITGGIANTADAAVNSSANAATAVASVIPKLKAAGTNALDAIGNLTVKEILGVAKNVATAPMQVQQAALRNLAQAGIKTGQDIVGILTGIAKQKGATDQEIKQYLGGRPTSHLDAVTGYEADNVSAEAKQTAAKYLGQGVLK